MTHSSKSSGFANGVNDEGVSDGGPQTDNANQYTYRYLPAQICVGPPLGRGLADVVLTDLCQLCLHNTHIPVIIHSHFEQVRH